MEQLVAAKRQRTGQDNARIEKRLVRTRCVLVVFSNHKMIHLYELVISSLGICFFPTALAIK